MAKIIERFWSDETGNSTVDWLILTAGIVMLGAAITASINSGSTDMAGSAAVSVPDQQVGI